jgi:hypothetical protein
MGQIRVCVYSEARELAQHGRDRVECAYRSVSNQCLNRRIDHIDIVRKEVRSWQEFRNNKNAKVNRQFTAENAQIKLSRLYPTLESDMTLVNFTLNDGL